MPTIQFGTDGWRGVIGDDFTFANVRAVAQAVAEYIRREGDPQRGLIVAYDTRFLSPESARLVAETVAAAGIPVRLADRPTPTPAVSYGVVERRAAGAIMVTASHNPSRWNGIKFKASYGGSADSSVIRRIESYLPSRRSSSRPKSSTVTRGARVEITDLVTPYLQRLKQVVRFDRLRASGRRFVIDPMYGAGSGLLARLFDEAQIPYREIHNDRNPLFPGLNPEPIEPHIQDLRAAVLESGFDAGFATDGDADRLGAVDQDGTFIDSHRIFSLLLRHLVEDLGLRGEVVKTFSTTQMVDGLARKYGLPLYITPIGFKYICERMRSGDVLIGGEESGGIAIKGHPPERDGILNSLLLAELMAEKNRSLGQLVQELSEELGPHFYGRIDLELDREAMRAVFQRVRHYRFRRIGGLTAVSKEDLDGCKMFFDRSTWLLVRPSGTENLLRLYAEAPSREQVQTLLDAAVALAKEEKA